MEQIKYVHREIKAIAMSNSSADFFFVSEMYRILRAGPFVGKRVLQNTKRDRCELKYDKQERRRRREDTIIVSHHVVRPLDVTKSHCVADVLLKSLGLPQSSGKTRQTVYILW